MRPPIPLARPLLSSLIAGGLAAGCGQGAERGPGGDERAPTAGDSSVEDASTRRPSVALILIDTLRPDHLQSHGYASETSPFLAELAGRAVVFDNAFSTSSWTAPSTASVFTGLYPNEHGVVAGFRAQSKVVGEEGEGDPDGPDDGPDDGPGAIELITMPGLPTLPELLKAAGYVTHGLATNINIGAELGFDRGFDEFERLHKEPAEGIVARALEWREGLDPAEPYFLYLHLNDVHKPYEGREEFGYAPPAEDGSHEDKVAAYDSEIRYVDHWLERLFEGMGWDDGEAVVMLVSDHGEEFRDHGGWGHRYSLHAEVNDVLMMLYAPGLGVAGGRRAASNVSLIDVRATLLEAAGYGGDELGALAGSGRSLLDLAREPDAPLDRTLFAHRVRGRSDAPLLERKPLWSVVAGRWKLLDNGEKGTVQLFDTRADPAELRDLADERPDVVERLAAELARFREEAVLRKGDTVHLEVDDELLEHLEELGYAGRD